MRAEFEEPKLAAPDGTATVLMHDLRKALESPSMTAPTPGEVERSDLETLATKLEGKATFWARQMKDDEPNTISAARSECWMLGLGFAAKELRDFIAAMPPPDRSPIPLTPGELEHLPMVARLCKERIEEFPGWRDHKSLATAHAHAHVLAADLPDALRSPIPPPTEEEIEGAARTLWDQDEYTADVKAVLTAFVNGRNGK